MNPKIRYENLVMHEEIVCQAVPGITGTTARSQAEEIHMLEECVHPIQLSVRLELGLTARSATEASALREYTRQLIGKIIAIDPTLGMTYEANGSHFKDDGAVLVFRPGHVDQPAVRLAQILEPIRNLVRCDAKSPIQLAYQNVLVSPNETSRMAA